MGIQFSIPQTSRFIQTENNFTALFNNPLVGKYSFNTAANTGKVVLPLQSNTLYLVERLGISGNVAEDAFFDSISTFPQFSLKKSIGLESVFEKSFSIPGYINNQETTVWIYTDKGNNDLTMSLTGILNQTADLVGKASVILSVSLSIYAIEDRDYIINFRNRLPSIIPTR